MSSSTDENGRTTGYQYADSLARLTEIDYPDQGRTTNSYSDVLYTPSVTTTKLLGAAGSNVATTVMDGVGHVTDTNVNSSIYVHSAYDGSGRVWCKSYPYSGGSLPSCGANFPGDTYAYDALGRVTGAAHPDGTAVQASYAGRATKVIDEAGIARVTQSDALGRLRSVCEVTATTLQVGSDRSPVACGQDIAATGFLTTYQYDALDNLLDVHQSNPSPDRQFAYDSLSRLVTASNPESGTMYYAYDPNGNLLTRTRPAPNQANPAVTVTTTYVYDSLNRVARKTYSDGVTPEVDFVYDQAAASFGGPQHSSAFANGRLSFAFIPNSATDIYSYDQMGRVTDTWQCVTAPCTAAWDAHQVYDLGGDMLSVGYNSGATLNYSYDGTQRLSTVSGSGLSGLPATLFSPTQGQQQYGPVGLLYATLGNNLAEARAYNNRTWLSSLTVGSSGSVYSLGLGYAGNGDVTSATDSVNSNWSYCYDDFNRLTGANTPPQSCTANPQTYGYLYDRFGNRWQQSHAGQGSVALSFNGSNQISSPGYQYDAAGNLLMDNFNCYTYDAENRLSSVAPETTPGSGVCGTTTMSYLYDPEGRRVARLQNGSIVKQYYYDAAGHMITEANASGNTLRAEIYAGNRHLATWSNNATYFNHADWLGTERARTNATNGARCETIASLPFGDGAVTSGTCAPTPTFFTGKERDTESGLDYFTARHYGSGSGRFISPDPGPWIFLNPQSYNAYAYSLNNPLRYSDDSGETAQDRVNAAYGFAAQRIQYRSGGKEPGCGLDCSGLVQNVFRADPDNPIAALSTVQNAASQASLLEQGGYYSTDINNAQPGDAIFFKDANGNIVHTGIVVDIKDGKVYFIHAPHVPLKVSRTYVDIKTLQFGKRIPERFAGVGRPFEPTSHPSPNAIQNYSPNGGWLWNFLEELFFNWTPPPPPPPPPPSTLVTKVNVLRNVT